MFKLHDWTLRSIDHEWKLRQVRLFLHGFEGDKVLTASGVRDLHVPQTHDWGASVSVNKVHDSTNETPGLTTLRIEMQSGDTIAIVAESFVLEPA